jgi:hypothetical protein
VGCALALVGAATATTAAPPNRSALGPGQRIDVRVLLISADGTEPGFGAWKAELTREGVPYDTLVAYTGATPTATLTDDRLADYSSDHAKYSAVILSTGDLGRAVTNPDATTSYLSAFTDAEWATLAKFERTFGIRQLSDYTAPGPAHGLVTVGGAAQDGLPPGIRSGRPCPGRVPPFNPGQAPSRCGSRFAVAAVAHASRRWSPGQTSGHLVRCIDPTREARVHELAGTGSVDETGRRQLR